MMTDKDIYYDIHTGDVHIRRRRKPRPVPPKEEKRLTTGDILSAIGIIAMSGLVGYVVAVAVQMQW